MATKIFIVSGTTFIAPGDWPGTADTVETIGGGGNGFNAAGAGGGGGGGYSLLNSGGGLTFANGAALQVGGAAQDTWISNTGVAPTTTSQGCLAKGGVTSTGISGGAGGAAASGVGNTKFSGGTGGTRGTNGITRQGGGGGAAGPLGNGGNGGDGGANGVGGAGGGGGNGGGANGAAGTDTQGGNGGNNQGGTGSGAGGVSDSAGSAGTNGGGGGGASATAVLTTPQNGGPGGAGTEWDASHGSGGGGGGEHLAGTATGTGGLYGGGGGGRRAAAGAQGIIVITYTAAGGGTDVTVNPTGVSATGSVGSPSVSGGASIAATGVSASGAVGDEVVAIGPLISPAGLGTFGDDHRSIIAIDQGAHTITQTSGSETGAIARAHIGRSLGSVYWEITGIHTDGGVQVGILDGDTDISGEVFLGNQATGYAYWSAGHAMNNNVLAGFNSSWGAGDTIGIHLSFNAAGVGSIAFYKNGTLQTYGFSSIPAGKYFPAVMTSHGLASPNKDTLGYNFGDSAFAFTQPSGSSKLQDFVAFGQVGTVAVAGGAIVSPTGVSATGQVGDVAVGTGANVTVNPTGVSATGSVGDETVTAGATVSPTGVSATGAVGTATVNGNAAVAPTGVSATGAVGNVAVNMAIRGDFERSSVKLSSSSIVGSGDSAVISIFPKMQTTNDDVGVPQWWNPAARVDGVNGFRPTFRFLSYLTSGPNSFKPGGWDSTRRPMFSYDLVTWTYFDTNVTVDGTNHWIEFRHSAAFTQDTVYISHSRLALVSGMGTWLAALEAAYPGIVGPSPAAIAFTPTLTTWPAQSYIADEFSTQTDDDGGTVVATPFYAALINDTSLMPLNGGAKRLAVVTSGTHAAEDTGTFFFRSFIETLLGPHTWAQSLRRNYKVLIYPTINAPGRTGGGTRGGWTKGPGGIDDANRHFDDVSPVIEIVVKPRAVMVTDAAGVVPDWMFDTHSAFNPQHALYTYPGEPNVDTFRSRWASYGSITVGDLGTGPAHTVNRYWHGLGARLAMTLELSEPDPFTDAEITNATDAAVRAMDSMALDGLFGVAVAGVSATGAVGTPTVTGGATVNPTGVSATGSVGTVIAGTVTAVQPTGVQATGQVGSPTVSGNCTVNVTGVQATGAVGNASAGVGVGVNPTGVQAAGAVGSITINLALAVAVSGVSATGRIGNVIATGNGTPAPQPKPPKAIHVLDFPRTRGINDPL